MLVRGSWGLNVEKALTNLRSVPVWVSVLGLLLFKGYLRILYCSLACDSVIGSPTIEFD